MTLTLTPTTTSWLWATGRDRLADPAGRELAAVIPGRQVRGRHWWACERTTRAGDRALLCSLAPGAADVPIVAYRVEVLSDARVPRPWEGWDAAGAGLFVCDYVVRERLVVPTAGTPGSGGAELDRWRSLPQVRRGGAFPISDAVWDALVPA